MLLAFAYSGLNNHGLWQKTWMLYIRSQDQTKIDLGTLEKASSEPLDSNCQPKQTISHFKTNQCFVLFCFFKGYILIYLHIKYLTPYKILKLIVF